MIIDDDNFKHLNNAVQFRDLNRIKYLIKTEQININIRSSYGKNVLYDLIKMKYLIIESGHEKDFQYILENENTMIILEYLVEQGIDLNAQATDGMNIILWSSIYGDIEVIKFLLKHKASLNLYNISYNNHNYIQNDFYCLQGYYPIHFATMKGHYDLVKFFLNQGVEIDLFSYGNLAKNSLHIAILHSHYEIIKLLLNYGADPKKLTGFNCNPVLLSVHAINSFSYYNKQYYRYDLQIITKLLEFGYDYNYYKNYDINILIKPLLKNAAAYIEAANFLLDYKQNHNQSYHNSISILAIQIIFDYAIQYQILSLAMKCLNILKQIPSENDIYLKFKEIMLNANLSRMFDGAVIACKYGLKGSNKVSIPFEIVNNIVGFSYGNYLNSTKSNLRFNLDKLSDNLSDNLLSINNKINTRIKAIYSFKK